MIVVPNAKTLGLFFSKYGCVKAADILKKLAHPLKKYVKAMLKAVLSDKLPPNFQGWPAMQGD